MERLLLALLTMLPMLAMGQVPEPSLSSSSPDPQRVHHFWLGASFASEAAYRTGDIEEQSARHAWIVNDMSDRETFRFGYTTAISMSYAIDAHWSIGSGVGYSKKGYRTKTIDINKLTFPAEFFPRDIYLYATNEPPVPDKVRNVYGFAYVSVPIQLNYVAGTRKIRSFTTIGLSIDRLMRSTSVYVARYPQSGWDREIITSQEQFAEWNLTPMVSTGIAMELGTRLRLTVAPVARYGLLRIIDAPITGRLWSVGLEAGIFWAL